MTKEQRKWDLSPLEDFWRKSGVKPRVQAPKTAIRSDKELARAYRLSVDDALELEDARFLEQAASLAVYEAMKDIGELSIIRQKISAAYGRCLSLDNRQLISLAESAVTFHGRIERLLKRLLA